MFGANIAFSLIPLISSILLLDAASISIRSIIDPLLIDWHISQNSLLWASLMQQFGVFGQFIAFAKTLAVVVLPTPLGPQKR